MRTLNYHKQSYEKETIDNNCSNSSLVGVDNETMLDTTLIIYTLIYKMNATY